MIKKILLLLFLLFFCVFFIIYYLIDKIYIYNYIKNLEENLKINRPIVCFRPFFLQGNEEMVDYEWFLLTISDSRYKLAY